MFDKDSAINIAEREDMTFSEVIKGTKDIKNVAEYIFEKAGRVKDRAVALLEEMCTNISDSRVVNTTKEFFGSVFNTMAETNLWHHTTGAIRNMSQMMDLHLMSDPNELRKVSLLIDTLEHVSLAGKGVIKTIFEGAKSLSQVMRREIEMGGLPVSYEKREDGTYLHKITMSNGETVEWVDKEKLSSAYFTEFLDDEGQPLGVGVGQEQLKEKGLQPLRGIVSQNNTRVTGGSFAINMPKKELGYTFENAIQQLFSKDTQQAVMSKIQPISLKKDVLLQVGPLMGIDECLSKDFLKNFSIQNLDNIKKLVLNFQNDFQSPEEFKKLVESVSTLVTEAVLVSTLGPAETAAVKTMLSALQEATSKEVEITVEEENNKKKRVILNTLAQSQKESNIGGIGK